MGPCGTNAYSGDVAYAAKQAGLLPDDLVVYRNADATKSWFMLDDEIVVLAAGVGDSAGRAVTTTIDTRIADVADAVTLTGRLRDHTPWSGAFAARIEQAAGAPHASVAYAIVPNATEQQLSAYARGPISVIANTTRVQAVKRAALGLVAANAFADPTMNRDAISVKIHGPAREVLSADDGVEVRPVAGGAQIDVATRPAYGRTFTATLR